MDIDSAAIGWKLRQVQASEVISTELVQEICNFFWQVTYLTVLAESHLAGANEILPPQSPPSNIVIAPAPEFVCDVHPLAGASPDVAANAHAATAILFKHSWDGPPPICPQRVCHGMFCGIPLPVIVRVTWITIVDARCIYSGKFMIFSVSYAKYVQLLRNTTLNCGSQELCCLLPPSMIQKSSTLPLVMVCVGPRSFYIELMSLFRCLATAVDEATPSHDLRGTVHHGVNFLTAQIQETISLGEGEQGRAHRHKTTCQRIQTGEITNRQPCRSPV